MAAATRVLRSPLTTGTIWLVAGALLVPIWLGDTTTKFLSYNYVVAVLMIACGLNLVLGYAGQLFLGPGAIAIAGAYAAAYYAEGSSTFQSLPMMCLVSVVVAIVISALAAIPTLRVNGFYLGLVTLFLAQIIPTVASQSDKLGKDQGISLVLSTFQQNPTGRGLFYLGVAMLGVMALYCWLIVNSRLGRRFTAIRASDELAVAVGVPTYTTKLTAFLLASVPCAIGGAFYLYSQQFVSPTSITPQLSIYILAGLVIGGGGTIIGPLLGTCAVMYVNQFMEGFTKYQGIVFGAVLVVVAMVLPRGFIGLAFDARMWVARKRGVMPSFGPPLPAPSPGVGAAGVALADDVPDGRPAAGRGARLVVKGVSRSFGGVRAVNDVDLVVEPGTVHALVGPNGSGKTTLLNLVSGYYKLHGGEVWLGDERLDTKRASDITRSGVARTFQTPKLSLYDTAVGNVLVGADRSSRGTLLGAVLRSPRSRRTDRDALQRSIDALAEVGLADQAASFAAELPHGTQRLVEIARVVALEPRLVLLDEPAAGLSVAENEVLKSVVRRMAAAGLAVLLVEHNLPVVFDVADHVTVLDQGEVLASGTPAAVSADPEVIRVYLGRSRPDPKAVQVLVGEGSDD